MYRRLTAVVALLALLSFSAPTQASILGNALTPGLNTINDTDGDRYTPAGATGLFAIGDVFDTVLTFNNISNSSFFNTILPTAVGTSPYELSAVATLEIIDVQPTVTGGAGRVDLLLSGTIKLYETTNPLNFVDFATDTFNGAVAKVQSGTLLLELATDFYQQLNAPASPAGLPTNLGNALQADAGFSVTNNPGGIPIVPGVTEITYDNFLTGVEQTTAHDLTASVRLFRNLAINTTEFPLFTDTTVQFTCVPEPTTIVTWFALSGIGAFVGFKSLKNRKAETVEV